MNTTSPNRGIPVAATLALALTLPGSVPIPNVPEVELAGSVVDAETGRPIVGASISILGTRWQNLSDSRGRYVLRVRSDELPAAAVLRAEFIGYRASEDTVQVVEHVERFRVDFRLDPSQVTLDALVVSGGRPNLQPGVVATNRGPVARHTPPPDGETYARIVENDFLSPLVHPVSTLAADVDRAAYANLRRFLHGGSLPPVDAVRIEEMVNYFDYDLPDPTGTVPFSVTTEVGPAPWRPEHRLVRIAVQGRRIAAEDVPPSNLVFLIDTSGSMRSWNKLDLVKVALRLLTANLRSVDRVAIVTYAGSAGLVLPSTPGGEKRRILDALEQLEAGGSTAGGEGIRLAYDVARRNFLHGGNNRVILATDGDFNVGPSSDAAMERLIEDRRDSGVFLTVLGFGYGNLKDSKLETLADHGNGNYAYIDDEREARKALVDEMAGTLFTIAKDVKFQVEWNPARVARYRLIGYENRLLKEEDFDDDRKDAGEVGAGHSVTVLFEVEPASRELMAELAVDSLRYARRVVRPSATTADELGWVNLRYKDPDASTSRLIGQPIQVATADRTSHDQQFAAAVAAFGMLLRDSEHIRDFSLDDVHRLAAEAVEPDPDLRQEFLELVEQAAGLRRWTHDGSIR